MRQQETKMQYYIITSPLLCDGLAKMCTSDLSNDEQDNSANEERPNKLIQHAAFVNVRKSKFYTGSQVSYQVVYIAYAI